MQNTYTPISCALYDTLEDLAVKKEKVTIKYLNENSDIQTVYDMIADFQTKNKEEFMILQNRLKIRLDKIIEINDTPFTPNPGNCKKI
jgi:transcriptional antiterminator Rof (Rho-off)